MNKPTDYPVKSNNAAENFDLPSSEITYAVLRDRVAAKQPVTDEMIRAARNKLDNAHANRTRTKGGSNNTTKFKLPKLRTKTTH